MSKRMCVTISSNAVREAIMESVWIGERFIFNQISQCYFRAFLDRENQYSLNYGFVSKKEKTINATIPSHPCPAPPRLWEVILLHRLLHWDETGRSKWWKRPNRGRYELKRNDHCRWRHIRRKSITHYLLNKSIIHFPVSVRETTLLLYHRLFF